MNKFLILASLTLAACTGGKDSADTGAEATATATATATETATATATDTSTGTGTTDVVTSCTVSALNLCVEFVNFADSASWCSTTNFGTATGVHAAGPCAMEGRVAGSCAIDGDANATDDYTVDATAFYYGSANGATMCTGAGGTWTP